MLRLAALSARGRLGAFAGALVALFAAAALSMAWGMQLESILRTHAPVERYAAAAAVVTGQQEVANHTLLGERARLSSALAAQLAAVPGVKSAVGDVSVPGQLGGRVVVTHGWTSAALTPYALTAGRPPARPDEVVTGFPAALGARLTLAAAEPARTVTVVGVARGTRRSRRARAGPHDLDPGHGGVRRAVAVHRDLRRGQHAWPVDTAARARDRAAAGGGRDARPDPARMIAWEATAVALVGSAAGIMARDRAGPGARARADKSRHRAGGLLTQLRLAGRRRGHRRRRRHRPARGAGRRTARRPPALALTDAAVEPRLLGPGRVIGEGWSRPRLPPSRCSSSRPPRAPRRQPRRRQRSTRSSSWWRPLSSVRS